MPKLVPRRIVSSSASRTTGGACPSTSGPHESTKSMYSLPSTSQMREPSPRSTTNGSPPTPRNARTGEFTPPGNSSRARAMICREAVSVAAVIDRSFRSSCRSRASARARVGLRRLAPTRRARATPRNRNRRRRRSTATSTRLPGGGAVAVADDARHAVDVVGLPDRARLDVPSCVHAIDDRPRDASDAPLVALGGDQSLQLDRAARAARASSRSGTSSAISAARVPSCGEYVNAPTRSNCISSRKVSKLSKSVVGLTGKADDARRANRDVGNASREFARRARGSSRAAPAGACAPAPRPTRAGSACRDTAAIRDSRAISSSSCRREPSRVEVEQANPRDRRLGDERLSSSGRPLPSRTSRP